MIADDEPLVRRIHPSLVNDGRPASAAFRFVEREMSVDREKLRSVESLRSLHPGRQFARLHAGTCRSAGCEVVEAPLADNPAHANVVAPDAGRRELERLSRALRDSAQFPL